MLSTNKTEQIKGFTLIELSIVVVVISIIIGGIIAGQSILDGAKRQAVVKELKNYEQAVGTFVLQYSDLPGDIDNASAYWSAASDGDGDGEIDDHDGEGVYIWNHLSRAELVSNYYDGTYADLATSVPQSDGGAFYYKAAYAGNSATKNWGISDNSIYGKQGNFFGIGSDRNTLSSYDYAGGMFNAEETKSIDQKIDDGKASSGRLVALRGYEGSTGSVVLQDGCVDSSAFDTSDEGEVDFDIDSKQKSCRLVFWLNDF
jgi:prepilin-type N-terminal cleavage/methylation domain-containing protein